MAPPPPQPPRLAFLIYEVHHKSRLPPRPTLRPRQGPRQQLPLLPAPLTPAPLGMGQMQNGGTPSEAYPQCNGFLRSSPSLICKEDPVLPLSSRLWLGSLVQPWLGKR